MNAVIRKANHGWIVEAHETIGGVHSVAPMQFAFDDFSRMMNAIAHILQNKTDPKDWESVHDQLRKQLDGVVG